MKINKSKRIKIGKIPIILSIVGLVVVFALYLFLFKGTILGWSVYSNPTPTSTINYSPPTDDQKKAGEAIKEQSVSDSSKPDSSKSDAVASPQPQAGGKSVANLTVTSKNQTSSLLQ